MGYKSVIDKRIAGHLLVCKESARLVVDSLQKAGVTASLFGSTLRGDIHTGSDIDILILDYSGVSRGAILDIAERTSRVPVDVLFAEDVKPAVLRMIKEQINAIQER